IFIHIDPLTTNFCRSLDQTTARKQAPAPHLLYTSAFTQVMHISSPFFFLLCVSGLLLADAVSVEFEPCWFRGDQIGVIVHGIDCDYSLLEYAGYDCSGRVCRAPPFQCIGNGDAFHWAKLRLEYSNACVNLGRAKYDTKFFSTGEYDIQSQVADRHEDHRKSSRRRKEG
ncbi:hypothetical protein F5H01DRAFT_395367, partial [Linnemannia elongata]